MDDNFLFKIKSSAADFEYIAALVKKEGLASIAESETKRAEIRKQLVGIMRNVEFIQTKMGSPVEKEFQDVEVQ